MKTSFSTDVVDLHHQMPNRNRYESKYYWDELYTLISAAGFSNIEIPYEPKWNFGGRSGIPLTMRSVTTKFDTVENYVKTLNQSGIEGITSVHLDPSLFCSNNMDMYFGAFSHFGEEAIQFAAEADAECVTLTVSPSYYAVYSLQKEGQTTDELEDEFLKRTALVIDKLAEFASEKNIKLCLKNEYWGLVRGNKIIPFLERLNSKVYLDVDTANLQIAGIDVLEFIKNHGNKIGIVHFSDTSFVDNQEAYKQALPEYPAKTATKVFKDIGQGSIAFKEILNTLNSVNYSGQIVYRCKHSYDVTRSLLRTRYYINTKLEI